MPELRRIALLLRSLDELAAAAVLSRLPSDVRRSVATAMEQIAETPTPECEAIARDFLGGMRRAVKNRPTEKNIELRTTSVDPSSLATASLEALIDRVSVSALADLVRQEHPQICAVMVARLSPDRAAELLQAIAPENRADVLRRVLALDEADRAAVDQIRELLATRLRDQLQQQQREAERMQRVQAILGAAHPDLRDDLLEVVEQNAAAFPTTTRDSEASPPRDRSFDKYDDAVQTSVSFDRLVDCEAGVLQDLFRAIPSDVSAVALSGASQPVRSYILDRLPEQTTNALTQRLGSVGPLRIADIHIAQAIVLRMLERSMTRVPPANHRMTLSA